MDTSTPPAWHSDAPLLRHDPEGSACEQPHMPSLAPAWVAPNTESGWLGARVVDFGPSTNPDQGFPVQKRMNLPGKSPPFCSEF